MDEEFLKKVIALLESGDDTGCDGLVVVSLEDFKNLREAVYEIHGQLYGSISQDT